MSKKQLFQIKILGNVSRFYKYLGTSWIEATEAIESMGLLTVWWKAVFQILWNVSNFMWFCGSCEWKYLWDICTMNGATVKSLLKRRVWLASVQNVNFHQSPRSCFSLLTTTFFTNLGRKLRYESSTLILYKELSSTIFQSLSVSPSVRHAWHLSRSPLCAIY